VRFTLTLVWALSLAAAAPQAETTALQPIPRFPVYADPLTIARPAQPGKPFTVAGPYGALLGDQRGTFEAWLFPVKILSRLHITAELEDYHVPIDVMGQAATIEVAPAMTTITYSHAAFTIKQRMFMARSGDPAGIAVLYEIASTRPLTLTFDFEPDVAPMWPAPNYGPADAEWVKQGDSGYYVLHTNNSDLSAAIAMPRAQPGIRAPYQERPKTYPTQLQIAFDPKKDSGQLFPLLIARKAVDLAALDASIAARYAATESYYRHFFDTRVTAETPDKDLDRALQWAEISIDQARVRFGEETGLAAGYYTSGDSARPGFGWFFGRDTLWTSYAINSYGDFDLTREALDFLFKRQRADGKIMHEFSQTAEDVDWKSRPYFYAAADSTPLLVMAMEDYVDASGDVEYLRRHWDAVKLAYNFTRAHETGGIYDNSQGTGWVESWPPGMPHQESYLAALDQQSAQAMSRLASRMHDGALSAAAREKAEAIRAAIESNFFADDFYAFSRNADGTLDKTATIFPSVAWWTGRLALSHAEAMLDRWASPEFSTDWGTRDISRRTSFYDPISYHQGSVWPLFTGWVSLAEYRAGRPLAGYQHLMQNVGLTWAQDLGAVTELLSGEFFQPLGRSSSHQTWSSAMVLTPALRGLFGLRWDDAGNLDVVPNLPASWDRAVLRNVPVGNQRVEVEYSRQGGQMVVRTKGTKPWEKTFNLPAVEVEVPHQLPLPGAQTAGLKVVHQTDAELVLEAPGGSLWELPARVNRAGVRVSGAELVGRILRVRFPEGTGYQQVTLRYESSNRGAGL